MSDGKRSFWRGWFFVYLLLPSATFFVGWLWGHAVYWSDVVHEQRNAIAKVLESDAAYKNVRMESPDGDTVVLAGSVPTKRDFQRLTEAMIRAVGFQRGEYGASMVKVESQKEGVP